MARDYLTEAIVLGSRKLGEADRIVDLFTADRGRVPTVVKGIRKVSSRWGGRLEPFTLLKVRMYEGRNLHTLTGADTVKTYASLRDNPAFLKAGLSVVEMVSRSTPELHQKPRTYNLFMRFLEEMERAATLPQPLPSRVGSSNGPLSSREDSSLPLEGGESGRGCRKAGVVTVSVDQAAILALASQLKILLLAGFLPHLLSCASCRAETELTAFSALSGGALCPSCQTGSFPITAETLEAMRYMLENSLRAAAGLALERQSLREIRRAVREICEYHLGVRLKVEPW